MQSMDGNDNGNESGQGDWFAEQGVPQTNTQGRENFDAQAYLDANPDVAKAIAQGAFGGDPYRHYLEFGQREGRAYTPVKTAAPATTRTTKGSANTGVNGGGSSFADKIRANLQLAYPTKSKDQGWLDSQVKYYEGRLASGDPMGNGQRGDEAYYLERALGMGNGGADVAEAGKYAGQDFGTLEQQQGGRATYGDGTNPYGNFTYTGEGVKPIDAPTQMTPGTITPRSVTAAQVQGPEALTARNVDDPTGYQGLTKEQLESDPSYQFRLSQGLGAIQNSAAARGNLLTGGVMKGLSDYAGQSASQEYAAADARARQTYNDTLSQKAGVIGQNNAAQANAYGLTNQYQQNAALANQSALNQVGMFNAGQDVNAQGQNINNQMNAIGQNNAANLAYGNYGLNAQNQAYNQQLGAYNANVNAGLGYGNLALGYGNYGLNVNNSNFNNNLATRQQNWNEQTWSPSGGG